MRLRSVAFRGLTRFTGEEPVTIDFASLGPGLIALVGVNGAGKSTAMESVPAALYRTFPTRPGSIYDYAHGRDSFIEAVFDDAGEELKVRLAVDAERRMTEGYIFLNGASLTTGRAAEFEGEIEKRFGSMPLFLASVFAAQDKSGSFLLKKKAERKSLFIELLGLAALEVMAEAARDRRAKAAGSLEMERQRVADVEVQLADLSSLKERLDQAAIAVDAAAARLTDARAEEASALSALERARAGGEKLAALQAAADSARREVEAADAALQIAKKKPAEVDADVKKRLALVGETDVEKLKEPARRRHADAMERINKRRASLETALADVPDADAARQVLAELRDERTVYEDQRKELEDLRRRSAVATNDLVAAELAMKAASEARRRDVERLTRQAAMMEQAPCTAAPFWSHEEDDDTITLNGPPPVDLAGTCPLLGDARGARAQMEAFRNEGTQPEEQRVADAHRRASELHDLLAFKEAQESPERGLAAVAARERDIHGAIAKAEAAVTAREQLATIADETTDAHTSFTQDLADAEQQAADAREQRLAIENDRADALLQADAACDVAQTQLHVAAERYGPAHRAWQEASRDSGDVAAAERAREDAALIRERAEASLRDADVERAGIRARVEALQKKEGTLQQVRERVAEIEMHLGDWSLLERALGKDGVQALEIDASGPAVGETVNELLASCYGTRFSIAFETLREKKSVRGEFAETFDVKCFDAGAERPVEALSGGEKVVIGEAIGLAIAILNARKSGIRWETLWRDETAGALDPENADRYVLMLRRARELGGFHQVIFVSHSPEVTEAADVRLVVAGGRVTVEAPGVAA